MSSNPFNNAIAVKIVPSLQKWLLVLVPHLWVMGLVLWVDVFTLMMRLIILGLVLLSGVYYGRLHLRQGLKKSVLMIQQDSAKNWQITIKGDEQKSVTLLPSSFISQALMVLNYRGLDNKSYPVLITPDSVSNNDFRRLRVRLKLTNNKKN